MVNFWWMMGFATTCVFFTCAFFLFLYFLQKLLRVRKTTREILPFIGLAIVFLFISVGFIMFSWIDYYWWESGLPVNPLTDMQNITGLLIIGSFGGLTFLIEFVEKRTKYLVTLYLVGSIITLIFLIYSESFVLFVTILLLPFVVSFIPLWYVVFIRPTAGFLRTRMILALFGLIAIEIGIFLRFQIMTELLGLEFYTVGTVIAIIGVCLMGYGFSAFSTFTDLKWKDKMREIFVISENGICLYAYSFEQNLPLEDTDLIAGGFSGIQGILSEMVKTSESLHLIDYKNVKIMLEQGTDAMFVLIIKEESTFLEYKLRIFAEEFQAFFKEILPRWAGEIDIFKPTGTLIQRVFEVAL